MTSSPTPACASFTTSAMPGETATFCGCADAGMRSMIAGAFVSATSGATSAASPDRGTGCETTANGAAGAITVLGCSDCAEGRAQPIKNTSPAANPRLHFRAMLVFIKAFFVAASLALATAAAELNIHYRLGFFISYSGTVNGLQRQRLQAPSEFEQFSADVLCQRESDGPRAFCAFMPATRSQGTGQVISWFEIDRSSCRHESVA